MGSLLSEKKTKTRHVEQAFKKNSCNDKEQKKNRICIISSSRKEV